MNFSTSLNIFFIQCFLEADDSLALPAPNVRSLDVSSVDMSDDGAAAFGSALRDGCALTVLRMDRNGIAQNGAAAMCVPPAIHQRHTPTLLYTLYSTLSACLLCVYPQPVVKRQSFAV